MSGKSRREERLALVEGAFRSLSDRYLGAEPDFDVTYHVVLGDVGHVWEVRCNAAAHVHTLLRPGMDFGDRARPTRAMAAA